MASRGATLRGALAIPGGARPTPAPQGGGPFNNGRGLNAPGIGQISPLAAQLANESGYANAYGPFLPRPARTFTEGAFGPFSPILPVPVDTPPPDLDRPELRRYEYQVGWNLPTGRPGLEGLRLCSFETMGRLADVYSIARACIEYRKNQIRGIEWDITPTPEAQKAYQNSPSQMADFGKRRAKALAFFKRPDRNYISYASWISTVLEEVLVYDALSILLKPVRGRGMRKGVLGSDLDSFVTVHGPTIRPLLNLHGGTPRPPAPAYQQYLYGVPRGDVMTVITQRDIEEHQMSGQEVAQFRGDQLMYIPMVPRTWTPYGLSAIERGIIPIMTGLQKQSYQYDWFSECHDDQTEILTRDGWKLFEKLSDDDEVATRSADGEFQWQKPTARQKYWHDGEMVHFQNRTVDILVTPNHRMLVRRPKEYAAKHPGIDGSWKFRFAGEFLGEPKKYELPLVSQWNGSAPDEFVLEKDGPRHREFRAPMKAFCEFLGLFLAEGWTNGRNCVIISQTPASRHLPEVKRIIEGVGLKWKYDAESRKFFMANARLTRWLNEECGRRAWNKHVPREFKDLPPEYLELIWSALIMGDGVTRENGVRCLTTTSEVLAGDAQEMLQKMGVNSRIAMVNANVPSAQKPHYLNGRLVNNGRPQYNVGERMRADGRLPIAKAVNYAGYVHCVTVPNGVVLTRRAGKSAWTGNSTVPASYIIPGDTAMTPNQMRELQDALNAIAGDPAWKQKIIVLPAGSHVEPQKPVNAADELDQWLTQEVTMAFGLSPMEIGVTPGKSSSHSGGAQNQMAKMTQDRGEDTGVTPILLYLSDIFNLIITEVFQQTDMRFTFEGLQQEEDQDALTGVLVQQFQNGMRTLDECRQELNLQPYGLQETSEPLLVTPNGVMPISTAVQSAVNTAAQQQAQAGQAQAQTAAIQAGAERTQAQTAHQRAQTQMAQEAHDVNMAAPDPGTVAAQSALMEANAAHAQARTAQVQAQTQQGQESHDVSMQEPKISPAALASQNANLNARTEQTRAATQASQAHTQMAQEAHDVRMNTPEPQIVPGGANAQNQQDQKKKNAQKSAGDLVTDVVIEKRASAEFSALARHLAKGRPVTTWEARFITQSALADVARGMAEGLGPESAVMVAKLRASRSTVILPDSEYEWVDKKFSPEEPRNEQGEWEKAFSNVVDTSEKTEAAKYARRLDKKFDYTPEQAGAISAYTDRGHESVNEGLRTGDMDHFAAEVSDKLASAMKPLPHSLFLYRKLDSSNYLDDFEPGDVISDPGFSSTSLTDESYDMGDEDMTVMHLLTPKGTPAVWARPHSQNKDENEIILSPGQRMQLVSKSYNANRDVTTATFRVLPAGKETA